MRLGKKAALALLLVIVVALPCAAAAQDEPPLSAAAQPSAPELAPTPTPTLPPTPLPTPTPCAELAALAARFRAIPDFSVRYRHTRTTDKRIPTAEGGTLPMLEKVDGKLKVRQDGKLRFNAVTALGREDENGPHERLYATDGTAVWRREACPTCNSETVREEKEPGKEAPAPQPAAPLYSREPGCAGCFMADPYRDLSAADVQCAGEEQVDERKTLHLVVPAAEGRPRRDYWIAEEDGIPRKILEYYPGKPEVETEYLFTDIRLNNGFGDEQFRVQ